MASRPGPSPRPGRGRRPHGPDRARAADLDGDLLPDRAARAGGGPEPRGHLPPAEPPRTDADATAAPARPRPVGTRRQPGGRPPARARPVALTVLRPRLRRRAHRPAAGGVPGAGALLRPATVAPPAV